MRKQIWRYMLAPLGDLVTGQRVMHYLKYYQESQYWPTEKISEERDRQLRHTLSVANQEVPFYRDLWRDHGIDIKDIRQYSDLPALPVVTKDMLRNAFPDRCTRRLAGRVERQSTSGSTGRPFASLIDADSQSRARALMFMRAMLSGYEQGDLAVQTGMIGNRGTLKRLKDLALGVRYLPTVDLTDQVLDRFMEKMARDHVGYLMGYAQSLEIFARRAIKTGLGFELDGAVSWGSILLPEHRELVRRAFNCRVHDSYGVSEGMQIAAQCDRSEEDFHQFSLHVAVEFCRNGQPVPRGETGDVLLTRLNPGAMPFIRYAVGDMGRFSLADQCSCGRHLPLIGPIMGRTSDIIITPNGNKLVIHFFSSTLGKVSGLLDYQAIQKSVDHLHIQIVADQSLDETAWQHALRTIELAGGSKFRVTNEQVESIQLAASGKRQYIRSEISS